MSLLLLSGSIGLALAQEDVDDPGDRNSLLKGTYQVTNHISCVDSQEGFDDPPTLQARGSGGTVIDTDSGAILFDGYGNATDVRRGITIFPGPVSPGSFPSGTYEVTCRYTYSVNTDKSFTLNGSCNGTLPAGPAAGLTVDIPQAGASGQISESGDVYTASSVEPVQQLLTLSQNGVEVFRTWRLCGTSSIGIRVRR
jgi:hypothetical protein